MKKTNQNPLKVIALNTRGFLAVVLFFVISFVSAQQSYMKDYNGLIATISGGQTVGQTFVIDDSFPAEANAFTYFEIHHQSTWNSKLTLKIYEGTNLSATPRYVLEDVSVPKATPTNKVHKIELKDGAGDLSFQKGKRYTVTFTMQSNFRWNGQYNQPQKSAYSYWPNNGGMWKKDFSYYYSVGVSKALYMLKLENGFYLDADAYTLTKNGGKVQLWAKNANENQKWELIKHPTANTFSLVCYKGGLCLDANATTMNTNGGNVQLWDFKHYKNQKWVFEKISNDVYFIKSLASGKYLTADKSNMNKNGGKIYLNDKTGEAHQKWKLIKM